MNKQIGESLSVYYFIKGTNSQYLSKNLIISDIIGLTRRAEINVPIPMPMTLPVRRRERTTANDTNEMSKSHLNLVRFIFFADATSLTKIS